MNRDEFEAKYAQKYMGLSFVHNPSEAIESVKELRDGEGYSDHHIDLCWKVENLLAYVRRILKHYPRVIQTIESYVKW